MSAKRSHSPIEFRIRKTRQEGVGAQCRLPNEARPVRGDDFLDDLMVHRHEADGRKVRPDLPGLTLVFLLYQKGREDRAIDDFTLKGKTKERHF